MYVHNKYYLEKLALKINPHANTTDWLHSGLSSGKFNIQALENAVANKRLDPNHLADAMERLDPNHLADAMERLSPSMTNSLAYSVTDEHKNLSNAINNISAKKELSRKSVEELRDPKAERLIKKQKDLPSGVESSETLRKAEQSFASDPEKHMQELAKSQAEHNHISSKEQAKNVIDGAKQESSNSESLAKNVIDGAKQESSNSESLAKNVIDGAKQESSNSDGLAKNLLNYDKSETDTKPYAIIGGAGLTGLGAYMYYKNKNKE